MGHIMTLQNDKLIVAVRQTVDNSHVSLKNKIQKFHGHQVSKKQMQEDNNELNDQRVKLDFFCLKQKNKQNI